MKRCHKCNAEWTSEKKQPAVKEYCEKCTAYLHCCLNCRFHSPSLHNQCQIPNTDWVGDRAGANFCDEFEFVDRDAPKGLDPKKDAARKALDGLFGDADLSPKKPKSLDDLFGG
jgi:hypothetical protein